jgi:hypothetical protein
MRLGRAEHLGASLNIAGSEGRWFFGVLTTLRFFHLPLAQIWLQTLDDASLIATVAGF